MGVLGSHNIDWLNTWIPCTKIVKSLDDVTGHLCYAGNSLYIQLVGPIKNTLSTHGRIFDNVAQCYMVKFGPHSHDVKYHGTECWK